MVNNHAKRSDFQPVAQTNSPFSFARQKNASVGSLAKVRLVTACIFNRSDRFIVLRFLVYGLVSRIRQCYNQHGHRKPVIDA